MKTATIKWTDGMQFIAKGDSGHALVLDVAEEFGGNDSGARPAELTLMALGGCTSVDVIMILQKKRLTIDAYDVVVEADTEDEAPKVIKEFRVKFIVKGNISEKALKQAIELSAEKYCSVGILLSRGAKVRHMYELTNEEGVFTGETAEH